MFFYREISQVLTDPYFANVSLLLRGGGTALSISDDSSNNFTVTKYGNAQISNSIYKYGTTSLAFDGNGDYLTLLNSNVSDFNTGNFTIECWYYHISHTNTQPCIFSNYNNYTAGALSLFAGHDAAAGDKFQVALNGGGFPAIQSSTTLSQNTWYHLAVVRNGTTISLYVNGVSEGSVSISALTSLNGVGSLFYVGSTGDNLSAGAINGNIDDLRITKGVARYTVNFTPPAAELPNS